MTREQVRQLKTGDCISFKGLLFFILKPYKSMIMQIECMWNKEGLWVQGGIKLSLLLEEGMILAGNVRSLIAVFYTDSNLVKITKPDMTVAEAQEALRKIKNKNKNKVKRRDKK